MAKRKTKKKKKAATPKRFLALQTGCGSSNQLEPVSDGTTSKCAHATAEAARASVARAIDWNGVDGTVYVIAEIIDVGAPNGVTWGGKGLES
jgi:hypothetical protein